MKWTLIPAILLSFTTLAHAEVKTKTIEYKLGDTVLEGTLAWDDAKVKGDAKVPGILVIHEWWGCNDYAKNRAKQLAELGYIAFAVDMYGKGKTTADPKQAMEWSGEIRKDPALGCARIKLALDTLLAQPNVDPKKIAAIGYCFGGTVALELARSGADLAAVVSFHGTLTPAVKPAEKGAIKAKILVCTGGADKYAPPEQVAKFQQEMADAGADWQVIIYGGAVHAFTNPDADSYKMDNVAYNKNADLRSWAAMKALFAEAFK